MKKKILSIALAGAMAASMVAVGNVAVSAEEKAVGGYGTLGEYTPSSPNTNTWHIMFAMPGAWQNETTKDPKCGGAAGIYWWTGADTPDDKAGGHGWPGYKSVKVTDQEGIDNLFAIDVPIYGNGDNGNAFTIIWDNYIDGGTETDTTKNPFYTAAKQTRDFQAAPVSRFDKSKTYDEVFRYAYKTIFESAEIEGAKDLDLNSETFWEDINKISAAHLHHDWDKLSADDKDLQANDVITEIEEEDGLDLTFFGAYAANFFNEDTVDETYPAEDPQYYSLSFTYDNMVFVLNFDPDKMVPSPTSGMIGYDGNFFFQYGNGLFGNWPTKELLAEQTGITFDEKGNPVIPDGGEYEMDKYGMVFRKVGDTKIMVAGNFAGKGYTEGKVVEPTVPTTEAASTVPAASTDAQSSTSAPASGSNTANNSNGAIATGQVSFVVIVLTVLIAGVGIVYFTRKKSRK